MQVKGLHQQHRYTGLKVNKHLSRLFVFCFFLLLRARQEADKRRKRLD